MGPDVKRLLKPIQSDSQQTDSNLWPNDNKLYVKSVTWQQTYENYWIINDTMYLTNLCHVGEFELWVEPQFTIDVNVQMTNGEGSPRAAMDNIHTVLQYKKPLNMYGRITKQIQYFKCKG